MAGNRNTNCVPAHLYLAVTEQNLKLLLPVDVFVPSRRRVDSVNKLSEISCTQMTTVRQSNDYYTDFQAYWGGL